MEIGPYTLTVSLADDDHGNLTLDSHRLAAGDSVEGMIDYNATSTISCSPRSKTVPTPSP